ncbi:MAG: hypothetical protein CFE37_03575 [Alphaproteobacteria bacterium PA4]|nr:MAG: hypothetical protein CFE37_03575 [Alphaproteobacteria bacterium PA4]
MSITPAVAALPTAGATRLAANDVAEKLAAAEAAIDAAIAAVASLTAVMPAAAQQAGVPLHVGHEAMMHSAETCQTLVKARTNIIRTHKALRIAQSDVGLDHVAFLPLCPPEPQRGTFDTSAQLAAVAA